MVLASCPSKLIIDCWVRTYAFFPRILSQLLLFSYPKPNTLFLPYFSWPSLMPHSVLPRHFFPRTSIIHPLTNKVLTFPQKTAPTFFLPSSHHFPPISNPFPKIPRCPQRFFELSLSCPLAVFSQINNHNSAGQFPILSPHLRPITSIFASKLPFPHICYIQHLANTKINVFRFPRTQDFQA